jgi:hypothetical protein
VERRFEDDRVRWPKFEVGDSDGVSVDDVRGKSWKGLAEELGEVRSPSGGSTGDDILNDIDRLCGDVIMGEPGMDTEAEVACVDLDLLVVSPDE